STPHADRAHDAVDVGGVQQRAYAAAEVAFRTTHGTGDLEQRRAGSGKPRDVAHERSGSVVGSQGLEPRGLALPGSGRADGRRPGVAIGADDLDRPEGGADLRDLAQAGRDRGLEGRSLPPGGTGLRDEVLDLGVEGEQAQVDEQLSDVALESEL